MHERFPRKIFVCVSVLEFLGVFLVFLCVLVPLFVSCSSMVVVFSSAVLPTDRLVVF